MDPNLIVGFGEKVLRAVEHLKGLDDLAEGFSKDEGDPGFICVGEPNPQGTKYLLKVEGRVAFPAVKWGIVIGDAVHCLRSALDQLVYGLCEKPGPPNRFPICRTEREWVVDAPRMYWSLPSAYIAVLNRAQPYHRGDAAHMHPLAILNVLWNLDKHRAIPALALVPTRVAVQITERQGVTLGEFKTKTGVALKHKAVIAESKLGLDGSGLEPKVRVHAHLTVNIGFGIIEQAPSINLKPVSKTFHNVLVPAVADVLKDAIAVQDASA
jgi:hypothetical protein